MANDREYYDSLLKCVIEAIGEERYNAARDEVLNSGNQGINSMIVLAIENLKEELEDEREISRFRAETLRIAKEALKQLIEAGGGSYE